MENPEQSAKASLREMMRLAGYGRPYWLQLFVGFLSLILASAISLSSPQYIRMMLDAAFESKDSIKLNYYVFILFLLYTLHALASFGRSYLFVKIGEKIVSDIRTQIYAHIVRFPIQFFADRKVGELASRLSTDVVIIQTAASSSVIEMIRQFMGFVGGVVLIAIMNLKLTVLMLSVLPALIVFAVLYGRQLRKMSVKVSDALAESNAIVDETLAGIKVVQSFVREDYEIGRYKASVEKALQLAVRRAVYSGGFIAFIVFVIFSGIAVVLWYGGHMVIRGSLSAGEMMAFIIYTFIIAFSFAGMAEVYSQFQSARGATKRVFELLDTEPEIQDRPDSQRLLKAQGIVEFKDVTFHYPGHPERTILHRVSLRAEAGEMVALVGPSGAGKTTIVSLIPRFYDVVDGSIEVDGVDIRSLKLDDLRSVIGIVPQETTLFSGTVRENILYGRLDATEDELLAAAKAAHAYEFIQELPKGFDTLVGERGVKLSGGQRQRIAIARALLKNPAILILDEATSSLDSESERLVQEALDLLLEGRTSFVIAHRLSTVYRADKILVIEGGQVVAQGTHTELLESSPLYKQLCELQFQALVMEPTST